MDGPTPSTYLQQRRRLRRVVDLIGAAALDTGQQGQLTLASLARVACWTPEHLDRMYRRAVGEPPMSTVRRLRLKHAADLLRGGATIGEAAQAAGYASTQAFGRAFHATLGSTPARWQRAQEQSPPALPLDIVRFEDDLPCHALSLRGTPGDVSALFDETLLRLHRSGSPRAQWQVFGATGGDADPGTWERAGGLCRLDALVLAAPLSCGPARMSRRAVARGAYARVPATQLRSRPWEEVLREAGWIRTDGEVLRHFDTDPALVAAAERREWVYLPIAPRHRR